MAIDADGRTPLHHAAMWGAAPCVDLLLAAAPEAAAVHDGPFSSELPLEIAIRRHTWGATRSLLSAGPAAMVLRVLSLPDFCGGEALHPLFTDFVMVRLPLSESDWALVPSPCRGLGRALPAALAHSSAQACSRVQHLPPADAERLRTAALCLARVQRCQKVQLPTPIV
jgi:hypothetical protein